MTRLTPDQPNQWLQLKCLLETGGQWVCYTSTASTTITEVLHIASIYNGYTTVKAFPLQNIHLI